MVDRLNQQKSNTKGEFFISRVLVNEFQEKLDFNIKIKLFLYQF